MLYLVEAWASMERGNAIDRGEGPGPFFGQLVERFQPQALYGDPSQRHVFMVTELDTPAKMAELMYAFTWWAGTEPTFTPIMPLEVYSEAIEHAKKLASPP
jgi:hypothetical protein